MSVKVTIKNGDIESFDDDNDEYQERSDGFLEVLTAGAIAKVYSKGWWVAVEGRRKHHPYDDILANLE